MSAKWLMFIAGIFLCGNLFCLMMDGAWFGAEDTSIMADLTGAQIQQAGGWAILSAPFSFIEGIFRMLFWDYSFLSGGLEIIQWILAILTIGTIYGLMETFIPILPNIILRK